MSLLSLNGTWTMFEPNKNKKYKVTVPSDNYTQLLELGIISDPYYSTNEKDVQWIGQTDWVYEREFDVTSDELSNRKAVLCCNSLDTLCDIYINDKLVGSGKNAFIKYEFDIKEHLLIGTNIIKIVFFSPVKYSEKKQAENPLPKNNNGTDGIAYIRKPACHFGWDWGPSIPLSGIVDNISIQFFNNRITDLDITQIHSNGSVILDIKPHIDGSGLVKGKIICPDNSEIEFTGRSSVLISNPELWWTRELSQKSEQPLYTVTASLDDSAVSKKIGLRTIRLDRSEDRYGENFCFYLNEVPIFAKGANWIIPDSLIGRVTNKTYDYYIDSALSSNFNMIRVWGGAYYGNDYFYEQCDKKGLLVWQDFMFACLMYPFYEEDFLINVLTEVKQNIMRIKSHPSLCLWAGNNEIETMFSYMPAKLEIVKWYKKFFYEILQENVTKLDPSTPYIPTSPIGKEFRKGVTGDKYGDTHMWSVWHGQKPLNYYRKRYTRFCSEFGLESLPSLDAIKTFAENSDLSLTSKVFNSHQKCPSGNRKMLFYLLEKFYEPRNFKDMIYMTGLIQKECISDATEHWRRNRGRCNGSLFWQFNDCWQAPSWSSIDYLGKWKPLQYHSRHFFEPVCISIEETKRRCSIYCINDLTKENNVKLYYCLKKLNGDVIFENELEIVLKPLSSECYVDTDINGNLKDLFFYAKITQNNKIISERTKIFVPDKDLNLQNSEIKKQISYNKENMIISLKSNTFCRNVMVDIEGVTTPFSDNYFDLLPNEEKVITLKTKEEYNKNDVTVKSLAQIPVISSNYKNRLYRLKFALEPLNIGNWFWYSIN